MQPQSFGGEKDLTLLLGDKTEYIQERSCDQVTSRKSAVNTSPHDISFSNLLDCDQAPSHIQLFPHIVICQYLRPSNLVYQLLYEETIYFAQPYLSKNMVRPAISAKNS